jgi:hypothetical protein
MTTTTYRDSQGRQWIVEDEPMPVPANWTEPEDVAAWNARPPHIGRRLIAKTGRISKNDYRVFPDEMTRV